MAGKRRLRTHVCIVCHAEFQSRKKDVQLCSRACQGKVRTGRPSVSRLSEEVVPMSPVYPGPGRFVVHVTRDGFVVWDTATDTAASPTLSFEAAWARSLALERRYGVLAKAA